ncbi:hypothetical protein BKA82DRAFT_4100579 [Pisolithus tinctorius]|nr:hypothetical protein BKA82DRAFT_4100579 [Pisolithus tinctorius]
MVDQYEDHVPQTDAPSTSQSGLGLGTAPDASYVEEMLLQIMFDEFEVTLEDNSAYDVARDIVRLWEDVCGGRDTLVKEWEAQAERIKGNVPRMEEGAHSGSDWEDTDDDEGEDSDVDMEGGEGNREDVPQLLDHSRHQPEVDEEGFTTVRRKGRR